MTSNASNALLLSLKEHSDQTSTLVDRSDGDSSSVNANAGRATQNSGPTVHEVSPLSHGVKKLQPSGTQPSLSRDGDPWQKIFLLSFG
jgi:hypothetical protein